MTSPAAMLVLGLQAVLLGGSDRGGTHAPLADGNFSRHVAGPEVSASDLRGRTVLLEYYRAGCKPCRNSLPGLVEAKNRYADDPRVLIVISYSSKVDDSVRAYFDEHAAGIPVYGAIDPPSAPKGGGYPHAHLIDREGRVVQSGGPGSVVRRLDQFMASAPGVDPTPLLDGIKVVALAETVARLATSTQAAKPTLVELQTLASGQGEVAAEAASVLARLREWFGTETQRMGAVAELYPAEIAWQAEQYLARFADFDPSFEAQLRKLRTTLVRRSGVTAYIVAARDFASARESTNAEFSAKFHARAKESLERLAVDPKLDESVRRAARKQLEVLGKS